MLKYLTKISMDIFPSVLATVIGAYIVNHYITARPAADNRPAAVAPASTKKDARPADVASVPAPGIKAKGLSEKPVISEKSVPEKPAAELPADKAGDQAADARSAETAAIPAASRAHQPAAREKAVARVTAAAPPVVAPAVEASTTPDANNLARAAIERLRKMPDAPQETARAAEPPRAQDTPRVVMSGVPAIQPLPPPITVSTPGPETYGTSAANPDRAPVGPEDANRLTPPADIPVPMVAPPLDLRADASGSLPRARTNVADEMLSGVKSMFHAVLPKAVTPE